VYQAAWPTSTQIQFKKFTNTDRHTHADKQANKKTVYTVFRKKTTTFVFLHSS